MIFSRILTIGVGILWTVASVVTNDILDHHFAQLNATLWLVASFFINKE